jgi:hypothetical protein
MNIIEVPAVTVRRVKDAHGANCLECSGEWNISTNANLPWSWRQSQAMHERGTGHKTRMYAFVMPDPAAPDPKLPESG